MEVGIVHSNVEGNMLWDNIGLHTCKLLVNPLSHMPAHNY